MTNSSSVQKRIGRKKRDSPRRSISYAGKQTLNCTVAKHCKCHPDTIFANFKDVTREVRIAHYKAWQEIYQATYWPLIEERMKKREGLRCQRGITIAEYLGMVVFSIFQHKIHKKTVFLRVISSFDKIPFMSKDP